jgi:hypothetical protein
MTNMTDQTNTADTAEIKPASDACCAKARRKRRFSVARAHMRFGPCHAPLLNRTYVTAFGRRYILGVPVDHGLDLQYTAAFGRLYNIEDVTDIPVPCREPDCVRYDEVLGDMSALNKKNT